MADATLKALQDDKNAKATAIRELIARHDKGWSAEDKANYQKLNTEHDEVVGKIDARRSELLESEAVQARLKELEDDTKARNPMGLGLDGDKRREADPERQEFRHAERNALTLQSWALTRTGKQLREEHRNVCRDSGFNPTSKEILFAADGSVHSPGNECDLPFGAPSRRYGDPVWPGYGLQREVRVGLDVATSGAAKETIPQGFMAELEKKTLAYGRVRQVARVIQTPTGNSMPWPVVDDTGNVAAILAEATTISTSVDPTFSAITFLAYKLSSKPVFASSEILQDSAFNLASELATLIGERFGRGENVYFTTGTNSSQPQGCVAAAGTGVTSAAAAAITADEIVNLIHSLDPSYRDLPSTAFMMHDSVAQYIRKFKDANGQYLWQPGYQLGVPDRILGYPLVINQQMTGTTSNVPVTATKHILFGAFEKYVIRDCGGVRMYHLTERYRDVDQDCFVAFKRIDARALNTAAFKVLLQA